MPMGPLSRLRRDRLATTALVLAAALAILSAGINRTAAVHIASVVDAHWRGAYDILVRPSGSRLDLEATDGLVEPNFIGFAGTGGLSLDQLAAIRAIAGVELAAPIAFVGYLRDQSPSVYIKIDHLPTQPTLYQITVMTTTTDGLTSQLVQRQSGRLLIGPAMGDNPLANWGSDLGNIDAGQKPDGSWDAGLSSTSGLPGLAVPILAVDPVAEGQLMAGQSTFLGPLASMGSVDRTAGAFDPGLVAPAYFDAQGVLEDIQLPDWPHSTDRQLPVIPLIVSNRQAAQLTTTLEVEQLGHALDSYPVGGLSDAAAAAGDGNTLIGSTSADAGDSLAPLQTPVVCVQWPGSTSKCSTASLFSSSTISTRLVVRPDYSAAASGPDVGAPSFVIASQGVVGPDGDPSTSRHGASTAETGSFAAYRQLVDVPLAKPPVPFSPHTGVYQPFVLAPVGTFDPTAVKVPTDVLDYVPLGAYDPADTAYIADPQGKAVEPQQMSYPLLPNGLVTTPPLAITDIAGAQALRGDAPIDAVRVRVAGVTDFSADSQARIEAVASAIKALGLDVDVVAGSSPQAVDVYVPAYHVDQDPPTDLGWVRQHWTTIGAAERITTGFAASDLALLALALGAAAIWAVALASLRVEQRIREAAILEAIGWSRFEIVRWFAGEAAIGAMLIVLFGLIGFVVGAGSSEALGAAVTMAAVWLLAGVLAALDATRRANLTALGGGSGLLRPRRLLAVGGLASYALRAAMARLPWLAATAVGLGAAAAAISLGVALVAGLSSRIGPTLLATVTGAAVVIYQPLMLVAVALGSLAFVVAALRLDRQRRVREALVLSVSGWSSERIGVLLWLGLVPIAIVAAVIGAVLTAGLAGPFEIDQVAMPVAIALGIGLSVLVWARVATRGIVAAPGDLT